MRELHLIRAAKRRLLSNAAIDTVPSDSRVAFRSKESTEFHDVMAEYYVPGMFHMAWTLKPDTFVDLRHCDLLRTKSVLDVYKIYTENSVRMLGNWPLRNICIVGRVVSSLKRDDDFWEVILDDGSFDGAAGLKIGVGSYAWTMMEVDAGVFGLKEGVCIEVKGEIRVPYEDETMYVRASSLKIVGSDREIQWWSSVMETRDRLLVPWSVDMASQDALHALRSIEQGENLSIDATNTENTTLCAPLPEIIEIEDEEDEKIMQVKTLHGMRSFHWSEESDMDNLSDVAVGSPHQLEGVITSQLVQRAVSGGITMSIKELLQTDVKRVAEGIVLGAIAREWSHGGEIQWNTSQWEASKETLTRTVLGKLARCGAVDLLGESVDIVPLRSWARRVQDIFSLKGNVHVQTVLNVLWAGCGRIHAVQFVAAMVHTGKVSSAWVWDAKRNAWSFQER